ncbi:MAG: hypothetical protein F4X02_07085 [Chloroflexi bacterium]|nr:hypothetical protein [Chloroflexota bacterium]
MTPAPAKQTQAPLLLGVDLGTQGLKVIFVDAETREVIATAGAPVTNLAPAAGYMEQAPGDWWASLCRLTRGLLRDHDIGAERIAAIGLSGHMHSIAPLRADGSIARNCIVWADTRSQPQAKTLALAKTRLWNPAIAPYSIAKILWLREHEPEVFREIDTILFSKDYLRYRMTGEIATDFSDASGSLMWDFATRRWDQALLAEFNLPVSLLPPARGSADVAGALTAVAANDLGLAPGTPVACGGGDAACAVVGAGLRDRDTLMINAGTAVQVIELQNEPRPFDRERANRYLFELGVAGQTFAIGALNSAGHSLEWWRGLVDPSLTHEQFEALAADEPSAADGPLYLPWLQGTGTPYLLDGPCGAFAQLSSTADRAILTRAVMDGVALGIRLCAEALVAPGGLAGKRALITGGVPKSPLMRQILSNVLPCDVAFRAFSDMSALGAVAHAAVAGGISANAGDFLAAFDYGEVAAAPAPALQRQYEHLYAAFKRWADQVAAGAK